MKNYSNKILNSLLGVAMGDALGAPVEGLSRDKILTLTNGAGINGFVDFNRFSRTKRIKDDPILEGVAHTTDDWQLTHAILTSLIRRKKFDLTDIALSHVDAYVESTCGWGGTTRDSLAEIDEYFSSSGVAGRSPYDCPSPEFKKGLGNGVAMKIAPVALFTSLEFLFGKSPNRIQSLDHNSGFELPNLRDRVVQIGKMTHSDPRAWAAAYAVSLIISRLMLFPSINLRLLPHSVSLLNLLIDKTQQLEKDCGVELNEESFSSSLSKLTSSQLLFGNIEDLIKEVGVSCLSTKSVVFAIAVFLRRPYNFEKALLEAVNAGGDTDTIAAIVGSMVGATGNSPPTDWLMLSSEFSTFIPALTRDFESIFL